MEEKQKQMQKNLLKNVAFIVGAGVMVYFLVLLGYKGMQLYRSKFPKEAPNYSIVVTPESHTVSVKCPPENPNCDVAKMEQRVVQVLDSSIAGNNNLLLFIYITIGEIRHKMRLNKDFTRELIDLQLAVKDVESMQKLIKKIKPMNLKSQAEIMEEYNNLLPILERHEYFSLANTSLLDKIFFVFRQKIGIRSSGEKGVIVSGKAVNIGGFLMKEDYAAAYESVKLINSKDKEVSILMNNIHKVIEANEAIDTLTNELKFLLIQENLKKHHQNHYNVN